MAKTYSIQGREFTLARVTPRRMKQYCELLGFKDFSFLKDKNSLAELNITTLNIALNGDAVSKAMLTVFEGDLHGIDMDDVDVTVLNEGINDFFSQLLVKSTTPGN